MIFTEPTVPEGTNVVTAPDGYVTLTWAPEDTSITNFFDVELQQATSSDFNDPLTRYRGKDRSTHISGLAAGDFYFRVRSLIDTNQPGPWSEPLPVRVKFISFTTVTLLLSLGAIVFVATVLAVVLGHRRTRSGEPEPGRTV